MILLNKNRKDVIACTKFLKEGGKRQEESLFVPSGLLDVVILKRDHSEMVIIVE